MNADYAGVDGDWGRHCLWCVSPPLLGFTDSLTSNAPAAVDLMQGAGFSLEKSKLLAGFNDISYMFCVLFAVFTLDRCGRRSTMVWGALLMALFLLLGGILDKCGYYVSSRDRHRYLSIIIILDAQQPGPHQKQFGGAVVALTASSFPLVADTFS